MLLLIFLAEKVHFIELLAGSQTTMHVSLKNAYFYLRAQSPTVRTCCISIVCRCLFICLFAFKSFWSCFRRVLWAPVSSLQKGTTSLPTRLTFPFVSPTEHVARSGMRTLPSIHTCPLSHIPSGTRIYCFPVLLYSKGNCSYFKLLKAPK